MAPPFFGLGLSHDLVRQRHRSDVDGSSFDCPDDCEHLCQSPHDDHPPSTTLKKKQKIYFGYLANLQIVSYPAVNRGQAVLFCTQYLAKVSPFGGAVQAS